MDAKYDYNWGMWCSIDPQGCMGWGSRSTLEGGGCYFRAIPNLIWVMDSRSDFRMMCGVVRRASRLLFQFYITFCLCEGCACGN